MIKVQIGQSDLKVWWHYFDNGKALLHGNNLEMVQQAQSGTTACVIEYSNGKRTYVLVKKYYKDREDRNAARRHSLRKLLEELKVPREGRKLFWKAYLQMINMLLPTAHQTIVEAIKKSCNE